MNNLDKFGQLITSELRDKALSRCLALESGNLLSPSTQKMIAELKEFSEPQREVIRKIVTNCIDSSVHDFLFAIEESKHEISVQIAGEDISKLSDGLQGEPYSEDGWYARYSEYGEYGI